MRRDFHPWPMREALPLLIWLFGIGLVAALGRWWVLAGFCLILFLAHALFHRSPSRRHAEDADVLVAPADGKVTDVADLEEEKYIKGTTRRIGIFLSVFDVHTQPAPCDCTLKYTEYLPGKFWDARDPKCSRENESQLLGLEMNQGIRILVRQISGAIARRIVLWRLENEEVRKGELLGMIRYGSRVELYLPHKQF
jgi:phosphatidylserine decarboxylase